MWINSVSLRCPAKMEKTDMKKIFAYTITAILLGSVIMLFPVRLFYASHGEEGPIVGAAPYVRTYSDLASLQEESLQKPSGTYGLDPVKTSQPTDPFVWTLALSFWIALVFYLLFRRRRPYASYRHYPFLPPD